MKIVLDTTAIRADYHLKSPTSLTFLKGLSLIPAKLCVPEVVIDEAVNLFRRDLVDKERGSSKARHELARLLGDPVPPEPSINVEQRVVNYKSELLERIREVGGEVLAYPRIDHKTLVQRDLTNRKPFKGSGAGYRDALIWETVRGLTWSGNERIVFVSDNGKDFGDGPLLHEDLRADIFLPERVTLVRSLSEVNTQLVLPKTQKLEHVRRELESHRSGPFDLAAWLSRRLLDLLRDEGDTIAGIVTGFPPDVGSAWPSEIVELKDVRVLQVSSLSENEMLIRLEIQADVAVSVSWDQDDYRRHAEVRAWCGGDGAFSSASTSVLEELRVGVDLILDRDRGDVVSEEVGLLATPACTVDYGSWAESSPRTQAARAPTFTHHNGESSR